MSAADACRVIQLTGPSGAGSTTQQGGKGSGAWLGKIIVGQAAASSVVTVYEGQDATGIIRATIDASAIRDLHIEAVFLNGFFITVTGGAAKVTVTFA